ncbi:YchJ family metal-binding protein [Lentisphaera marina]|uniref:YchJ family protein n=1 Tax=Lentisphaera marina TaxID=1111041 RepID=UPI0023671484|nr:YchJ family metal-binding protein [Lentisphaera marina]MDD7985536.1 YchJ family metal-binding protein [Lentisphaera marina]
MCPCGSGQIYESCCWLYHQGAYPESAEQLMRSRYCAFVKHNVDYLLRTQHQNLSGPNDRQEILDTFQNCQWLELKILSKSKGEKSDTEGEVEFLATYANEGQIFEHREKSHFKKNGPQWLYHSIIA